MGDNINVTVIGGVNALEEWESTDPSQQGADHKWIALDIDTGVDDITKLNYNGTRLTDQDVADAAAWGLGEGHFILWLRAEEVAVTPKTFILGGPGVVETTVTITVADAD